jgi:integrase
MRLGLLTILRNFLRSLVTQNNEDVKVVQELLRHANSRITLDLYAQAGMAGKREAQRKVVELVLKKGKAVAEVDQYGP